MEQTKLWPFLHCVVIRKRHLGRTFLKFNKVSPKDQPTDPTSFKMLYLSNEKAAGPKKGH